MPCPNLYKMISVSMFYSFQESIVGKCNVVCASNDQRNPQASEQQLEMADYIFYRSFDVGTCRISESFADQICGFKGWATVISCTVVFFFKLTMKSCAIFCFPFPHKLASKQDSFVFNGWISWLCIFLVKDLARLYDGVSRPIF